MTRAHLKSSFLAAALLAVSSNVVAEQAIAQTPEVRLGTFRVPTKFQYNVLDNGEQHLLGKYNGESRDFGVCPKGQVHKLRMEFQNLSERVTVFASCVPGTLKSVAAEAGAVTTVSTRDWKYTVASRTMSAVADNSSYERPVVTVAPTVKGNPYAAQ